MTELRNERSDASERSGLDEAPEHLLDALPDTVIVLEEGPSGVEVAWVNRAAEALLGRPRGELIGRACTEALSLRDAQGHNVCYRTPLGHRLPVIKGLPERDYELTRHDAEYVPVSIRCTYEKDAAGVVRRVVCTLRDARARRGMDMRTMELISTVSHEIRSPLTSIKGFTKTLLDRFDRFDDDTKREMLGAINSDADRVTRLLGELLDISRLETGRLRLRPKRLDIHALAVEVVRKVGGSSENHTVHLDFDEDMPQVLADPDKIEQVLTNLIENALKYTDRGAITVSGRHADGWVSVSVADEGEGISPPHLHRLFRKFYRRDRAGSPTGTGLGLYICKGLIEAHHGEISVASEPGSGSTFTFHIPV